MAARHELQPYRCHHALARPARGPSLRARDALEHEPNERRQSLRVLHEPAGAKRAVEHVLHEPEDRLGAQLRIDRAQEAARVGSVREGENQRVDALREGGDRAPWSVRGPPHLLEVEPHDRLLARHEGGERNPEPEVDRDQLVFVSCGPQAPLRGGGGLRDALGDRRNERLDERLDGRKVAVEAGLRQPRGRGDLLDGNRGEPLLEKELARRATKLLRPPATVLLTCPALWPRPSALAIARFLVARSKRGSY